MTKYFLLKKLKFVLDYNNIFKESIKLFLTLKLIDVNIVLNFNLYNHGKFLAENLNYT